MARIRTIKPEFFTSEDIVSLSPLARLLYVATWCEADKEGRLVWKPKTFKLRYFPGDSCDIEALCSELVSSGLVVPYGDCLAFIPSFKKHQHINPRESASVLMQPDASVTRRHASILELTDREEGKGREWKGITPLPPNGGDGDSSEPSNLTPYAAACIALKRAGIQAVNPSHPMLRALVDAGATPDEFVSAVPKAAGKGDGFAYVLATVEGMRKRAAAAAGQLHNGALPVQSQTVTGETTEAYHRRQAEEREAENKRLEGSTGPPPELRDKVKAMVKGMRI